MLITFACFFVLVAVYIADLLTTIKAVALPGLHESNPLARDSSGKFSLWRAYVLKVIGMAVFVFFGVGHSAALQIVLASGLAAPSAYAAYHNWQLRRGVTHKAA